MDPGREAATEVLAVDVPGGALAGPSSVARHAADLVAVLDHLGLDRVPVCGMSMGGFVAVELEQTADRHHRARR